MSEPPHKKLRIGTRSCLQCRRRKVRCTYDQGGDGRPPCDNCTVRQIPCESQETAADRGRIREPTRERVDRLEVVVQNLSKTVAELQQGSGAQDDSGVSFSAIVESGLRADDSSQDDGDHDDDERTEFAHSADPIHLASMLDPTSRADDCTGRCSEAQGEMSARERVEALIPSRDDLLVATASSTDWWTVHNALLPEPPIKSRMDLLERHGSLRDATTTSLAAVGTWLVFFAITLAQLPATFDISSLTTMLDRGDYISRVSEEVERMINDDTIIRTLVGLQMSAAMAHLQKGIGRPKKGWILLRRAISYAELLKLPDAKSALKRLHTARHGQYQQETLMERAHIWDSLCAIDRLLCLLLGLPSITNSTGPPKLDPADPNTKTRRIVWVQSDVTNQIIRRDRLESDEEALAETQKILEKLNVLKKTWPPEWKNPEFWTQYGAKTASCVLMQTSHGCLILRTHLPYLLKAQEDARYTSYAAECLQVCRAILNKYFAVRTRLTVGGFMSKSFDVLAFTASVILLLHRDGNSLHMPSTDLALVENAKSAMRQATDKMAAVLYDRMVLSLNAIQQCLDGDSASPASVSLKVPILGSITVKRNSVEEEQGYDDHGASTSPRAVAGSTIGDIAFDFDGLDDYEIPNEMQLG